MKIQPSVSALLVVCLMIASAFMGITGDYLRTSDSNGPFQAESGLQPGTKVSSATPESEDEELASGGVSPAASRTVYDPFGDSFPDDWPCPLPDQTLCDQAQLVGAAHNGYLNHFVATSIDLYPESAYTEPTALESMLGFEEILARLANDIVHDPNLGCWAQKGDGPVEWVQPCTIAEGPDGSRSTEEGSGDGDSGRSEEEKFKFRLLPYKRIPLPDLLPYEDAPMVPYPTGIYGGPGFGGCWVWGPGGVGTEHVWTVPCSRPFGSAAQIYGALRSDLLAEAEDLYENNNLGSMSEWERDRTVALHSVSYYSEGGGAVLSDEQRNLANEVFGLLEDYFKIAGDATEEDGDITLANLDQSINAVFNDSALESASPDALRVVAFVHATHYASKAFWTDYDSGSRWNWDRFWEIVGDTAGIAVGAALGVYGGPIGTVVGSAIVTGASASYKNSVGGGGGDPPVECPLDRSLDQNWWACAIFVATTRPLEEGDDGFGTEWAPDAIIPEFSKDWKGDYVSVGVYATDASGSAAADQLWDQEITEITRILVLHPEGGAAQAAWNCTTGEWPPWKDKKGYDCVELDPPAAHDDTRSIGLLLTRYPEESEPSEPVDTDSDGVIDEWDDCSDTASGAATDSKGCSIPIDTGNISTGGDDTGGSSLPGFGMPLAFSAMFAAAILIRRRKLV